MFPVERLLRTAAATDPERPARPAQRHLVADDRFLFQIGVFGHLGRTLTAREQDEESIGSIDFDWRPQPLERVVDSGRSFRWPIIGGALTSIREIVIFLFFKKSLLFHCFKFS